MIWNCRLIFYNKFHLEKKSICPYLTPAIKRIYFIPLNCLLCIVLWIFTHNMLLQTPMRFSALWQHAEEKFKTKSYFINDVNANSVCIKCWALLSFVYIHQHMYIATVWNSNEGKIIYFKDVLIIIEQVPNKQSWSCIQRRDQRGGKNV